MTRQYVNQRMLEVKKAMDSNIEIKEKALKTIAEQQNTVSECEKHIILQQGALQAFDSILKKMDDESPADDKLVPQEIVGEVTEEQLNNAIATGKTLEVK